MEGSVPLASPHRLTSTWHLHRAISWVRVGLPDALGTLLDTSGLSALFPLGPVGGSQPTATDDRSGSPTGPPAVHPAGISQNWCARGARWEGRESGGRRRIGAAL